MLLILKQRKDMHSLAATDIVEKVECESDKVVIVGWQGNDDPRNPQNFSLFQKWLITLYVAAIGFVVTMAGSMNSGANKYAARKFRASEEVMDLQTAMFLLGFGMSGPAMGSLSELYGRYPIYIVSLLIFSAFSMASGFAQSLQSRLVCRFFMGLFGAAPFSNSGGTIADIADNNQRTFFYPVYSILSFTAMAFGPIFGGWIGELANESYCDWLTSILGFGLTLAFLIFMPETHGMELLRHKSAKLRKVLNSKMYKTRSELQLQKAKSSFSLSVTKSLFMPIRLLITEPITSSFALYSTVVFVIMFGDLELFPILFQTWSFSAGETGSTFASVLVGICLTGTTIYPMYQRYKKISEKVPEGKLPAPEHRLWFSMIGTWFMPISLFWGGWVVYASFSPWWLIVSQGFFGFAGICCFISTQMYIIDVYQVNCASPLGAMTFLRYIVGGTCSVMWTRPMLNALGKHWAMTLLGFISVVASFIPIFFFAFGPKLRQNSAFAMAK